MELKRLELFNNAGKSAVANCFACSWLGTGNSGRISQGWMIPKTPDGIGKRNSALRLAFSFFLTVKRLPTIAGKASKGSRRLQPTPKKRLSSVSMLFPLSQRSEEHRG